MLWLIWIGGLASVFYVLYRLARSAGRRTSDPVPSVRRIEAAPRIEMEPQAHELDSPHAQNQPTPPIDLRARRVEKTVEALERRVIELEARLRKVEGRD